MDISKIGGGGDTGIEDERPDLLSSFEIESYIEAITKSNIMELGSLGWLDKHERIKQLAIQAVIQALSNREETVKDFLVSLEKIPTLVHDLILVELWRERVFPEVVKMFEGQDDSDSGHGGFAIYPILYHESAIINLLETVLYHSSAAETLGDSCLDLADYCLRTLTSFLTGGNFDEDDEAPTTSNATINKSDVTSIDIDLRKQCDSLLLGAGLKCLSTLRYLIENMDSLGHGLTSRLVVSTDTPMLLTELVVRKPWRREYWRSGKVMELDPSSAQWKEIDPSSRSMISNTEAQAWLSLYLLLKNNGILSSYELYDSRKNNLLKLRPYLNEMTLDQIPILGEFHLFLNQLAVTSGAFGSAKSPLLLELVPQMRAGLEEQFDKDRVKILTHFNQELVTGSKELMLQKAKRLASAYDFDSFNAALPIPKRCAGSNCEKESTKKCSRCKEVWYCGKECQVADWGHHRDHCVPKSC